MKAKLHPMFEQVSGQMGEMVYRVVRGKVVISRKPVIKAEPTQGQLEHRERFKQAVAYGKAVMSAEDSRELYEAAAKERDMPVFALMVADYFNAPSISKIDLSAYDGHAGNIIHITASDDFSIASLHVSITNDQGNPIEDAEAVETPSGSGNWVYTANASVTPGTSVNVQAVATDRPGGTAVASESKSF